MASNVTRTMKFLRSQGVKCAVVEKFNHYAPRGGGGYGIRQDLFGIIDVLALDPARGVVGVQVCGKDFQPHVRKILEERAQDTYDWLLTPGTCLELWGWRKVKKK